MPTILDLTLAVHDRTGRLEIQTRFEVVYSFEREGWQGSTIHMFAHMGTHV